MTSQTVFLAWQDKAQSRRWFPIGRLDRIGDASYRFGYVGGGEEASKEAGFKPLLSFPDFYKIYQSRNLFPMFQNRVMNRSREDFEEYLAQMGLDGDPSLLDILSVDGGQRATDNFEVFPMLTCDEHGRFSCRFFLHGWRHVAECSQKRLAECVREGDALQVALELTNPKTKIGLQIQTLDYCMIGWAPRYLAYDLCTALKQCDEKPENPEINVIQVNRDAPIHQRYLIEFKGKFKKYRPMQSDEFKLLTDTF
jgi:hypothetical protein